MEKSENLLVNVVLFFSFENCQKYYITYFLSVEIILIYVDSSWGSPD